MQSKLEQLATQIAVRDVEQTRLQGLDGDQRIKLEQQRLRKLQEEWREKLRVAEVEIAVQRAENARKGAEIEEKTRDIEAQLALAKKQTQINHNKDKKEKRRWLSR